MVYKTGILEKVLRTLNYIQLMIFSFICIYPFYYLFLASISKNPAGKRTFFWPIYGVTLENYKILFKQDYLLNSFFISFTRVVVGTSITVFLCAMFAYLLTRKDVPGRKVIYRMTTMSMYLSPGIIPIYVTYKAYGLIDNFFVYILPGAISAYYVILIKTYIEQQIDPAIEEAAVIDGAGVFSIFLRVTVIPLAKPVLAAIAVFNATGHWNSWYATFIFIKSPELYPVQYLCYQLMQQANQLAQRMMSGEMVTETELTKVASTPETVRMAISVLTVIPVMCFYPLLQKHFTKGIMVGAIKG